MFSAARQSRSPALADHNATEHSEEDGIPSRRMGSDSVSSHDPILGPGKAAPALHTGDAEVFARALDALEEGLAFYDAQGRLRHVNRPLLHRINDARDGEHLAAELRLFADALAALVRYRKLDEGDTVESLATRDVEITGMCFRLKGSHIGTDLFGTGPVILISVTLPPPDPLSDEVLASSYRLSPQEARVARLLAEGASNAEVASELEISLHTARHHTERVLTKLNASSRAGAVAKLLRPK